LLFILEKKVFLAKEYLLHLINKCSSSSTASQLHCLHILFSTAVFLTGGAREINIIRKKLKERYTKIWREKINLVKQNPATNRNENKLRTYCKFI
jgi:hypothetical protein